jgi:hypothetical protein
MSMTSFMSKRTSYTPGHLRAENGIFDKSRGVSANNRAQGFRPAFLDTSTGSVFLSRYTNGEPAPMHLLDGLPDEVVLCRSPAGRITAVKATLMAGFLRGERFYSREEADRALA